MWFSLVMATVTGFPVVSLLLLNRYDVIGLELWRDTVRNKERLVQQSENLPPPRLLAIGGSGVFYGIEASLLSERLGFPCYNLGTHAGFGLEYHIRRAKRLLRAGDIALLAAEYHSYYTPESKLSDLQWRYFFTHEKINILQLNSPAQICRLLFLAPPEEYGVSIGNWHRLVNGTLEKERLAASFSHEAIFMSTHGDMRIFQGKPVRIPRQAVPSNPFPMEIRAVLADFRDWCRQNDVRLLVTLPNALIQSVGRQEVDAAAATVRREMDVLQIATVGAIDDATFPPPFFFDTPYHLTPAGRRIRTELLAKALESALHNSRPRASKEPTALVLLTDWQDPQERSHNYGKYPDAEYRLWATTPATHPSQLDPTGLKLALANGTPVFTFDPTAASMLVEAGFRTEQVARSVITPAEILAEAKGRVAYFALTPDEALAWAKSAPLRNLLSLQGDRYNVGAWDASDTIPIRTGRAALGGCQFESHFRSIGESRRRPAYVHLDAHGNKGQNTIAIRIDRYRVQETRGGLVVIFNPALGLIESVHHTQGGEVLIESLYRVEP